ncbi:tetraspanin-32 isoform X4 [Loxodonta africana]|uniref:tetraspanin-32 isoform X4 n=1 Tax=Loxodonta africana TaxID=9785 RepID=UPI0030D53F06
MGPWSRVRVAKCQMLVTGLFVLLLGLSVAAMAVLTYFGAHFTVISRVSLERNPYEAMHHWAFSVGVSLAGLLTLGAVLCAAATVREAAGLMAGVEDAVLDTYDLVYEQAVQSPSSVWGQKLAAIQDTFQCCGKQSPFSLLGDAEAGLCPGELAKREDCLQGVRSFLRTHLSIVTALAGLVLAFTVYAMLLSSFLWAAIRSGCSLDHRGTYTLTPRARGRRPREPSISRYSQAAPRSSTPEMQAFDDHLGCRGRADGLRWCQHN